MITRPYFTIEQPKLEKIETRLVRGIIYEPHAYHDDYRISRMVVPYGMGFVAVVNGGIPWLVISSLRTFVNYFVRGI